jgi:hypothetical protein
MFYIVVAPCILTLTLGLASAVDFTYRPLLMRAVATLGILLLLVDGANWYVQHSKNNNSYEQFFTWERANLATGARIGVTDDVSQFVIKQATIGKWDTISALKANSADYVLVDTSLVEQGYSAMSVATMQTLEQQAAVAFSAHSRQDGTLYLFDVRKLVGSTSN